MRPAHFNRRSWRELQRHFKNVNRVAARLQQRTPNDSNTALFAAIAARRAQPPFPTTREVVVELVREMRAFKREAASLDVVASNTCPYCGGAYSPTKSCSGSRTDDLAANTCTRMRAHRRLVRAAIDQEESR